MKISKILLIMTPLLVLSACSNNDGIDELPPIPDSLLLSVNNYQMSNVYTTLVNGINYRLSVKANNSGMKYEDIEFTYDAECFAVAPMYPYLDDDTYSEYYYLCTAKQSSGSSSISVNYHDDIDTKTYNFIDTTIDSTLMSVTNGLINQDYNEVFYFSDYETYATFDSANNINKTSIYSESYFVNYDLAVANISYSSSTRSVNYQEAFIDGNTIDIAFNFIEDKEVTSNVLLKTYYIQLKKQINITDVSVFKSVQCYQ